MIAIYQRTASGVVRADTATTVAEAHDKLRGIRAPAMAFDGGDPVAATGYTTAADRDAIARHAAPPRTSDAESCAWAGCCEAAGRVHSNTRAGLVDFCAGHRHLLLDASLNALDLDSPRVTGAVMRATGATHCNDRRCARCKAAIRAGIVAVRPDLAGRYP